MKNNFPTLVTIFIIKVLRQAFLGDIIFTESAWVMGGMGDILIAVEKT